VQGAEQRTLVVVVALLGVVAELGSRALLFVHFDEEQADVVKAVERVAVFLGWIFDSILHSPTHNSKPRANPPLSALHLEASHPAAQNLMALQAQEFRRLRLIARCFPESATHVVRTDFIEQSFY